MWCFDALQIMLHYLRGISCRPTSPHALLLLSDQSQDYLGTKASMQKKNRDPVAERAKALPAAAKALEVVASLAPPIHASNQLALELD
jgi:hypothetical protein